ncbi:hypothetical protein [Flammeovirga sp. SJP92]|uniref:hypothetical protein n=1 Tax=Flammeovirga sp. SJP92 TaxID=1775430 RepID=UPI000788D4A0|nr:hypothetical protein [Flammeovirga sp. SJP92]KXX69432.1 hypothetical protein AVL50_19335 [Flammeovirga sp. SJP92]
MKKYIILQIIILCFSSLVSAQNVFYDQLYRADYSWVYQRQSDGSYKEINEINWRLNIRFTETHVRVDDSADQKKFVYKIDEIKTENNGQKIVVQANNYGSKFILYWGESRAGEKGWFLTWYWGEYEHSNHFKYKQEMSILRKVYY